MFYLFSFFFEFEGEKLPRIDASKIPKIIKVKAGKDVELEIPYKCKLSIFFILSHIC